MHRGFTLIEMMLVISILGIVTTMSIPLYRSYQLRTDLALAKDQIIQGLERTKLNAQANKFDTVWSFDIPDGIIFAGDDFDSRDTTRDEIYPMPSTVSIIGLTQVTYDKHGLPDVTGEVRLSSINGEKDNITVSIYISYLSVTTSSGDQPVICHHNADGTTQTMVISDAEWPAHQAHGDTIGPCGMGTSSSSTASSAASSAVSSTGFFASSSAASSLGQIPPPTCNNRYGIANGVITTSNKLNIAFNNLEAKIYFDEKHMKTPIPVYLCVSMDGGGTFSGLFGGKGDCKTGNGQARGHQVDPNGGDSETRNGIPSGSKLVIRTSGHYVPKSGLGFDSTYDSNDLTGHVLFFRNNDNPFKASGFANTLPLQIFLALAGKLNIFTGQLQLAPYDVLALNELQILGSSDADFDDDVLLMSFTPAATCP